MCSDRPGITPNDLDLESSHHMLERERDDKKKWMWSDLVEGRKGHTNISQVLADPTFLHMGGPSAVHDRTIHLCTQGPV